MNRTGLTAIMAAVIRKENNERQNNMAVSHYFSHQDEAEMTFVVGI
jgi:hypothetical protein